MADKYLLEDGSGGYLLEDGSGVLLLEGLPVITATLTVTEAVDTLSASSSVTVKATASKTEANDTLTGTSGVKVSTTLSKTEANDTLGATEKTIVGASLAATEANDSLSATEKTVVGASLSATEADDGLGSGTVVIVKTSLTVTEIADNLSANVGSAIITASLTETEAADTLSATATVSVAGINASANLIEISDLLYAVASHGIVIPAGQQCNYFFRFASLAQAFSDQYVGPYLANNENLYPLNVYDLSVNSVDTLPGWWCMIVGSHSVDSNLLNHPNMVVCVNREVEFTDQSAVIQSNIPAAMLANLQIIHPNGIYVVSGLH